MSVERVEWSDFLARLDWRQGEHVAMLGPTGCGKTTLADALLERRSYKVAIGTKIKDPSLDKLLRKGWKLVRTADQLPTDTAITTPKRLVFWPRVKGVEDEPHQAHQIGRAIADLYAHGSWCIYVDELWFVERKLHLTRMIETVLSQGRSHGVSLVVGTQRPAFVTLLVYDQPTHLFFWRENDERNLKRLAGVNGLNSRQIRETVSSLPLHDVLYVNTRKGTMTITRAPK